MSDLRLKIINLAQEERINEFLSQENVELIEREVRDYDIYFWYRKVPFLLDRRYESLPDIVIKLQRDNSRLRSRLEAMGIDPDG